MYCPNCAARTQGSETCGVFRDRRCTNAACGLNFTTRESVVTPGERRRLCARTHDARVERSNGSAAAPAKGDSISAPGPGVPSRRVESVAQEAAGDSQGSATRSTHQGDSGSSHEQAG